MWLTIWSLVSALSVFFIYRSTVSSYEAAFVYLVSGVLFFILALVGHAFLIFHWVVGLI